MPWFCCHLNRCLSTQSSATTSTKVRCPDFVVISTAVSRCRVLQPSALKWDVLFVVISTTVSRCRVLQPPALKWDALILSSSQPLSLDAEFCNHQHWREMPWFCCHLNHCLPTQSSATTSTEVRCPDFVVISTTVSQCRVLQPPALKWDALILLSSQPLSLYAEFCNHQH